MAIETVELQFTVITEVVIESSGVNYVELLPLVPEKFRDSLLFQDLLNAIGVEVGAWISKIEDMANLIDPYSVSDIYKTTIPGETIQEYEQYISELAGLIGLTITKNEEDTIVDFRKQLNQAIDWYKIKGTYQALINAIAITGQKITIKDFYTNDYVSFVPVDWFVADYPGENPEGLDSSYYKSPHFGLVIDLNQVFTDDVGDYLWKGDDKFADVRLYVEDNRPANTVPHYIVATYGTCNEDGIMETTAWDIQTKRLYEPWTFAKIYFDDSSMFDDGLFFDESYIAFLQSINKWKLGTGNIGVPPDTSGWALETEVLNGSLTASEIKLYDDRTEFDIVVDDSIAQSGLTEFALYLNDGTTLVIGGIMPRIDKIVGVELRLTIIMYR